ncbi:LacI family DNA-binding transcriptional regulator [Massilia sp. YMA4]|uniref:LacI family DNA-binding transcriptional regulator n=1 Tax=Massilia sp. YMA4 TaxID=1593482 RepID=UPI000DD0F52E|nr:LacI family DNA-binding transcriptional regulator [Massilia sp. YMA4]AXA90894.1 LacI family transcriptional regulator [Massilia sp. YMA4]
MTKTKTPSAVQPASPPRAAARRVTSYDVAMLAGVSQSAVSRCFKPGASVSKSTYARVMKAAAGLDYIPNAAARSLITRRSNMVAVVISQMANLYYPEALAELSHQIARRGKRVLLFTMQHEADVGRLLADIWQFQVDGAIVAAALTDAQIAEFERRRLPLVIFNRNLRRSGGVNSVLCDQYEAGRLLAGRLAAAGHRQFGIIAGPADSPVATERRNGATDRLRELGLPPPAVVTGQFDYASGTHGLREIIAQLGRVPDAVICGNDVMAIGCLDCARHELGLDVPGQLSVAGFDAVEPSNWLSYNLTTLRQPVQHMAQAAADLLAGLIDAREGELVTAQTRTFAPQFIDGATARLASLAPDSLAA